MIDAHVQQVLEAGLNEALEQLEGEQSQYGFIAEQQKARQGRIAALKARIESLSAALSV